MNIAVRPRTSVIALAVSAALLAVSGCQPEKVPESTHPIKGAAAPTTAAAAPAERVVYRDRIVYVDKPVPSAGPTTYPVLAKVGRPGHEIEIRFPDIERPLMRTAGLDVTLLVIRVRLCEEELKQRKLPPITDADVEAETEKQLRTAYRQAAKEDFPQLIQQIMRVQGLSRAEFDLAMRANAHLRRISETLVPDFNEATLQQAFVYQYGEKVDVSDIAVSNLVEVAEVQAMLKEGKTFAEVARAKSRDKVTASMGGQLPPFSKAVDDISQLFKDMAFSLKEGETSDPFQDHDYYHVLHCNKRVPPDNVKFADVKDEVARTLRERIVANAMKGYLQQLGEQSMATLKLLDPEMAAELKRREDAKAAAEGPTTRHLEQEQGKAKSEDRASETLQELRKMAEAKKSAATRKSP